MKGESPFGSYDIVKHVIEKCFSYDGAFIRLTRTFLKMAMSMGFERENPL